MQSSEEMNMVYKALKNAFDTRDSQYESSRLNDNFSIRTDAPTEAIQITPKSNEHHFDKTVVELVSGVLQQFCAVSYWFRTDYDDKKTVVMRIS